MTECVDDTEARLERVRQLHTRAVAAIEQVKPHLLADVVIQDAERIWHLLNEYTVLVSEAYELEGKRQDIIWKVRRTMFGVLWKNASKERGEMQDALSLFEKSITNQTFLSEFQVNNLSSPPQDVLKSSEPENTLQALFQCWQVIAVQMDSHRSAPELMRLWQELEAMVREFQSPSSDARRIGDSIRRWIVRANNLGSPFETDKSNEILLQATLRAAVFMHAKMVMKQEQR